RDDDPALMTSAELTAAQQRLCEGVRARERIVMDMLDRDPPDLLFASFAESHIAGHQFLNLAAPDHPRYDPAVAAELGDKPLRSVFEAIDAAAGRIVRKLPQETTVVVLCMNGVRVTYGASSILDDVLRKAGITASVDARPGLALRLWRLLPARL